MKIKAMKWVLLALLPLAAQQAYATGTLAGTSVDNTASVSYSVGAVAQPVVNSNTSSFVVDRRVNLSVQESGTADTVVSPGTTAQVLTFTVTNSSNSAMDFSLVASNDSNAAAHGGTDNFDASNVKVFVDVDNNGSYDSAIDTQTFLDEIAPDTTRTVFIVADIPLGRANGDLAAYALTAIAADAGTAGTLGSTSTATAGADTANSVDTVLADGAGDGSAVDVANDGRASDDDAYLVSAPVISVNKTSRVISDLINGTTNPKRIPGSVVEYCIEVTNAAGGAAASNVVVTDSIAGQPVSFNTGSIVTGSTACTVSDGAAEDDDAAGADETDPNGGSFNTGTSVATGSFPNVSAGATARMQFRVTIN